MVPNTQQAAEKIFAVIPWTITRSFLQEYGLEVSDHQAQMIKKEVLFLSVYLAENAIRASFSNRIGQEIYIHLLQLIRAAWEKDIGLANPDIETIFTELDHRLSGYKTISLQGGELIALFSEATGVLDSKGVVGSQDREHLLALFLDNVPKEEIGDVVGELESEWANF